MIPTHYEGLQPIEVMKRTFTKEQLIGFHKGNILKYVMRYDKKDGVKDLVKARDYLNWLIELETVTPVPPKYIPPTITPPTHPEYTITCNTGKDSYP